MKSVLVVDDKEMMRDSVAVTLQRAGFDVAWAESGQAALLASAQKRPDVIVTDMRMPGMTGLELLERVRQLDDELPVILMTAFGTIETAVKAMKLGAFDYLTKPFEGDELVITVKRAAEHRRLVRENALLIAAAGPAARSGGPVASRRGLERLIGSSGAMKKLKDQIASIAGSHGTVLITGESGVGKEVVARAIHEVSPRREGAFLGVNCAALSTSLLESELFGHERGAFTGAEKLRKGRFELADAGTLLLDEVSEIDPQIQAKLLRVLQERSFERVGSSVSMGLDVRVLATSNRDLLTTVSEGKFRQDLFFRLNVLPVNVPSLRERPEDVPELTRHFVAEVCGREGRSIPAIDPDAVSLMSAYHWPGNVRELQNICERAVVLSAAAGGITRDLVAPWLTGGSSGGATRAVVAAAALPQIEAKPGASPVIASATGEEVRKLEDIERETILVTLGRFSGHRQRTALALGIGVRTLGLKLKKWKELGLIEASV